MLPPFYYYKGFALPPFYYYKGFLSLPSNITRDLLSLPSNVIQYRHGLVYESIEGGGGNSSSGWVDTRIGLGRISGPFPPAVAHRLLLSALAAAIV